jgi:hypothetical protein
MLGFVPSECVRCKNLGGEGPRHIADRYLIFTERKPRGSAGRYVEHEAIIRPDRAL